MGRLQIPLAILLVLGALSSPGARAQRPAAAPPGGAMAELALPKDFEARRESSAKKDLSMNLDREPVEPGATTVLGELEGPGAITHLWCFAHTQDPLFSRALVLRIYWDGADYPSMRGTGTEEYFGYAWGLRPFSRAYFGVPLFDGHYPGDRASAYRWHVLDPIPFKKSLKLTIEHHGALVTEDLDWIGAFFETTDWFSSVAFWYQTPVVTFKERIAPLAERLAPYQVIERSDMAIRTEPTVDLDEDGVYHPGAPDAAIEFAFEVKRAGCCQINAMMGHMFTGPLYQPLVDG